MKAELKNEVGHCEKCGRSDSTLCARRLHHSSNPLDKGDYIILCATCNFELTKVRAIEYDEIKALCGQFTAIMNSISTIMLSRLAEIEGRYLAIAVGADTFEKRPSYDTMIGGAAHFEYCPELQQMIKTCAPFSKTKYPNFQQVASQIRDGILERSIPESAFNTKADRSIEDVPGAKVPPELDLNNLTV